MSIKNKMQTSLFQRKTILAIVIVTVALFGAVAVAGATGQANAATSNTNHNHGHGNELSTLVFHDQMRKLWEDHITWTRLVIVSIANGLPDTSSTVSRLLQNQVDIGNAIKPFYGNAAGNQLATLLHDHITIAAEILTDAKAGNTAALNNALARWYANANQIALFLHNANPENWSLTMVKTMMKTHLDLTLAEAVAYLKGDYAGSVNQYEQVHSEILSMADMLSNGIIAQFPHAFENNTFGDK